MAWTSVVFPVPSSPDNPITAGARSLAPRSSPNRLSSLAERRIGGGLELQELIAQHRRQLEIELFGGGLRLLGEDADEGRALARVGGTAERHRPRFRSARIGDAGDEADITHRLHDGPWRDAVLDVVGKLGFAAPVHLVQRALHRSGDAI